MDSANINDRIKEFLIFGGEDGCIGRLSVPQIKDSIALFLQHSDAYQLKSSRSCQDLELIKTQIENELKKFASSDISKKYYEYKRMQTKLQHLNLYKGIQRLRQCIDITQFPSLVLGLTTNIPEVLLNQSKIKKLLLMTVQDLRIKFLQQFHIIFEEHLTGSQRDESQNNSSSSESHGHETWRVFLSAAKDWMLAYSLVTLLPVVLTESRLRVAEVYQEALDEAFTPIWGRFHYHLEVARAACSKSHVVWTFNYSRSFVLMLCELSNQMTSSGQLQRLCDVDYKAAGLQHVCDKAVRFLRAHVAQVLVDFSPMSDATCGQLLEECMELDAALQAVGASTDGSGASCTTYHVSVCSVFFDAREVFHQLLLMEHKYFFGALQRTCAISNEITYGFDFGNASDDVNGCRVYSGVYACLTLFFLATERYRHMPIAAQRILSEAILEGLLCAAIALFLYRIRSQPLLYAISCGEFRPSAHDATLPTPLVEFRDSASYFQNALSTSCKDRNGRARLFPANSGRMRRRWTALQIWVPKMLIVGTTGGGYSLGDLLDKSMQLSERFTGASSLSKSITGSISAVSGDVSNVGSKVNAYEYRNIADKNKMFTGSGSGKISKSSDGSPDDDLSDCVEVAVGLADTLDGVMLRQYRKSVF